MSSSDDNDDVDELIDIWSYRRRRQRTDTASRTRVLSRRTAAVAVVVGLVVVKKKRKGEDDGAKNRCKSVQNVERFDCHPDAAVVGGRVATARPPASTPTARRRPIASTASPLPDSSPAHPTTMAAV